MRLIDADALKDWSEIVPLTDDGGIDINDFDEKLMSMPTVDAVPARHGRWLNKRYGVKFDGHSYPFRTIGTCSECRETSCDAGDYCPWCGAKMDEERKEE